MEKPILRKQTSQGQLVDIRLHENAPGWFVVQVYVDGQFVPGPTEPVKMEPPEGGCTHYLGGGYGNRPVIGLTEMEVGLVSRALAIVRRDSKFRRAGEKQALEERRRDLMMDYRRLVQRQQVEYEAAVAAGRPDSEKLRRTYQARVAAAEQAIREFDREHPDIVKAVLGEASEDTD